MRRLLGPQGDMVLSLLVGFALGAAVSLSGVLTA